ncbi:hypothetical protein J437_LFUL014282 [Ladona fulva]|uniref:Uncharacterized protein n=1 Tax=Ladona fulva TaxID=123851 RepID=A0A8K0P6S0_LADFU|nr:hypothetical protein J437_LFUL014282 [Ladona fulva]
MGTWKIPGSSEVNQIDHILVTQRHSTSVLDVRSCRGPNCDSDHYLVKAKIRERIIKTEKGPEMVKRRWDTDKLNEDTEVRKQYQKALASKMQTNSQERTNETKIEKEWEKIKEVIKEAAEETIRENKRTRNADWFDDECAQIIQEKNKARERMIQKETRMNTERYQRLRTEAKRICKKKKKEKMKKQLEDIEEFSKQKERRKFYKAVEKVKSGYQPRMEGCLNKEGNVLQERNKVLERWVEHFKELLNREDKEERELKKVNESKKSGASANDVYVPSLWYFCELMFLVDQETPDASDSTNELDSEYNKNSISNEYMCFCYRLPHLLHQLLQVLHKQSIRLHNLAGKESRPLHHMISLQRQRGIWKLKTMSFDISMRRDEAKGYAVKLRKITQQQLMFADKVINETLLDGQMGLLTRGSYLVHPSGPLSTPSPSPSWSSNSSHHSEPQTARTLLEGFSYDGNDL